MKRTILTLALVAATSAMTALAQDATPTPSATPAEGQRHHREGGKDHEGLGGPALEALTPAEREQLKAARQKAKDDPAVVEARKKADAARKALQEAEKAALLKADPTIGPVLEKLEAARKAHRPPEDGGPVPPPPAA